MTTTITKSVDQYYKFLQLRKRKKQRNHPSKSKSQSQSQQQVMIVPTYQIDLMWHTHILTSLTLYYQDCRTILGYPLHHDDSLNDRIEGGPLDVAFQATKASWLEAYKEPYFVSGGMYRGEPPKEFFQRHWTPIDSSCEISTGPFLKMMGVQGATSTNPVSIVGTTNTAAAIVPPPLSTHWTSVDSNDRASGQAGFVAANAKTRGANANPFIYFYIFGRGSKGIGYYHHTTKEAYVILEKRIANRVAQAETNVSCDKCCVAMFTCGMGHPKSIQDQEAALEELRQVGEIVSARSRAHRPVGAVGISAPRANMDRNQRRVYDTFYTDAGHWYFPPSCYSAGGGCGASGGDGRGGGCGGAGGTYPTILFDLFIIVGFLTRPFPFFFGSVPGCGGGGKYR
jgi:hypothetical protein